MTRSMSHRAAQPRVAFMRSVCALVLAVASLSCGGNETGPTSVPNAPSGWVGDFSTVLNFKSEGIDHTIIVVGVAFWLIDDELAPLNPADRTDTYYKTTAGGGMRVTYRDVLRGPGSTCTGFGQVDDVKLNPSDGQLTLKRSGAYDGFIRHSGIAIPYTVTCTFPNGGTFTDSKSIKPNVEFRLDIAGNMVNSANGLVMAGAPPALTPSTGVTVTNSWNFGPTNIPPL
jgi:hypothetical protein